ncbi:hypothetical protein F4808DRAFT_168295 [Astrocystis sublimbata]|nr:hypothetical protein F4808DRAFT_168295 [Astrocystis sublimbata]
MIRLGLPYNHYFFNLLILYFFWAPDGTAAALTDPRKNTLLSSYHCPRTSRRRQWHVRFRRSEVLPVLVIAFVLRRTAHDIALSEKPCG